MHLLSINNQALRGDWVFCAGSKVSALMVVISFWTWCLDYLEGVFSFSETEFWYDDTDCERCRPTLTVFSDWQSW